MKIPNSVRIGGIEYTVRYIPDLNDGVNMLYGEINYNDCLINLSETHGTAHEHRCVTLWHEILHGIREHSCMEIEDEEAIVDMFARGIYQVLQDNGRRFYDIAP